MILGCDAAGVDDQGKEVVVYPVIADPAASGGRRNPRPAADLLTEKLPGTLAERVVVPRRNLCPNRAQLSFIEAACLPTAWLTAYRMLAPAARSPPTERCWSREPAAGWPPPRWCSPRLSEPGYT